MTSSPYYSIGNPNTPWLKEHKEQWLDAQQTKRSFFTLVVPKVEQITEQATLELIQYGSLDYSDIGKTGNTYPLLAFKSAAWKSDKPTLLVTGGVHGYETSGVFGALAFAKDHAARYDADFNLIVVPCVSPWGFETINRWNPLAIDPNRSFVANSPAPESAALMAFIQSLESPVFAHVDLHETTDSDNSEFRPALAARDGVTNTNWNIPDGFYLVGDTLAPQSEFQRAVIGAVEQVTHIAPADDNDMLIGVSLAQFGVINYATKALGLCAGMTDSTYCTTTEVYPDSPRADDQNCIAAQVAAITGALDFLRSQSA